jgi:hypothetical protein
MSRAARQTVPWILWPIAATWDLVAFMLRLTGRFIGVVIALVLMLLSVLLGLTIVGLPVAIPLFILAVMLLFRSIF